MTWILNLVCFVWVIGLAGFAQAQGLDFGDGGMSSGGFGSFPTMNPRGFDSPGLPSFEPHRVPKPNFDRHFDPGQMIGGEQVPGGLHTPPPDIPTPRDLISEGRDPVTNPIGLTLPDPGLTPEGPLFPDRESLIRGLPEDLLAEYEMSPLDIPEIDPVAMVECTQLPEYDGINYALDLSRPDLTDLQIRNAHVLWIKVRVCRIGGSLAEGTMTLSQLGSEDARCVYYDSEDYSNDMEFATSEERQIIERLYHQYFWTCF